MNEIKKKKEHGVADICMTWKGSAPRGGASVAQNDNSNIESVKGISGKIYSKTSLLFFLLTITVTNFRHHLRFPQHTHTHTHAHTHSWRGLLLKGIMQEMGRSLFIYSFTFFEVAGPTTSVKNKNVTLRHLKGFFFFFFSGSSCGRGKEAAPPHQAPVSFLHISFLLECLDFLILSSSDSLTPSRPCLRATEVFKKLICMADNGRAIPASLQTKAWTHRQTSSVSVSHGFHSQRTCFLAREINPLLIQNKKTCLCNKCIVCHESHAL